jgi:hypothetical protein
MMNKILIQNPVLMGVDYYKSIGILKMNIGEKYLQRRNIFVLIA